MADSIFEQLSNVVIYRDEIHGLKPHPIVPDDIAEVRLARQPPEIVLTTGHVLFVPATQRTWLDLFCRVHAIERTHRVDVWSLLADPFLDTEFSEKYLNAQIENLASCGLDTAAVQRIRGQIRKPMLAYTLLTYEWAHYGHLDVLAAMHSALDHNAYDVFYEDSMRIAGLGVARLPIVTPLREDMRRKWSSLTYKLGLQPDEGRKIGNALLAAYSAPDRHYHNLHHIHSALERVQSLAATSPDKIALKTAAWFHDLIYEPLAKDNEAKSAEAMLKMLLPLCDNQAVLERAVTFIHRTAQPSAPADGPEEMFIDADFSILGEAPDVYDAYAQGIRDEYHAVGDDAFRTGRLRFLKQVEERDTIFRHLPPICEALARENIERERQMLVNQI